MPEMGGNKLAELVSRDRHTNLLISLWNKLVERRDIEQWRATLKCDDDGTLLKGSMRTRF